MEIVNTLSACSFGKSHTAEAMCQNLLSLSFLFDTLNGTRNFALHTAFVRLKYILELRPVTKPFF